MKYKVWHIERKEWIHESWYVYIDPDGDVVEIVEKGGYERYMEKTYLTDKVKVVRYTGLNDESEKPIHEGDILSFAEFDYNGSDTQYTGVVKFADGMYQIWNNWDDEFWGTDGAFYLHAIHSQDDGIKVIGNVFENPDLLPKAPDSTETA